MIRDNANVDKVFLSIVIPLHNEEGILWDHASKAAEFFNRIIGIGHWKFILVNNASSDSTPQIISKLLSTWPPSVSIFVPIPNYGLALRSGLQMVDTPYALIVDVDQWDFPFMLWAWRHREDHDLIIGSKRADPTITVQPGYRRLLSWGLNALLQLFFEYTGTDTHGPKLLRMSSLTQIIKSSVSDRGQFDTEIVLRATRAGLQLVELPIEFREVRPPRNLMIKKIVWNIVAFNRLRRILSKVSYEGPVRHRRLTREDVMQESDFADLAGSQNCERNSAVVGAGHG